MKADKIVKAQLVIVTGLILIYFIFKWEEWIIAAAAFSILSLIFPAAGKWMVNIWFRLAEVLGKINGFILLSLIYFLILTPVALLHRIFAKDPLRLKNRTGSGYHDRNHSYQGADLKNPW